MSAELLSGECDEIIRSDGSVSVSGGSSPTVNVENEDGRLINVDPKRLNAASEHGCLEGCRGSLQRDGYKGSLREERNASSGLGVLGIRRTEFGEPALSTEDSFDTFVGALGE